MDDLARPVDDADENDRHEDARVPEDAVTPQDGIDDAPEEGSEAEAEEAAMAAAAEQAEQGSLFTADVPPIVPAEPAEDERVTAFGGEPDDLEAIRMELGVDEAVPDTGASPDEPVLDVAPDEQPETTVVEGDMTAAPAVDAVEAAAVEAEAEGVAALTEAGVPEGADDDADAVEALLDAEAEEGLLENERPDRTLSLPYFVYVGVWLVFTIAMVVVLRDAAVAKQLDTEPAYPLFVLGGLVLTVLGPILSVVLWFIKRRSAEQDERVGLFASAILRGSLATFAGVVLWMIGLLALNYLKTGRLY